MHNELRFSAIVLFFATGISFKIRHNIPQDPNLVINRDEEKVAERVSQESRQDGWHTFPKASKHTVYGFVHIPKIAGGSFAVGSVKHIPDGDGYFSAERCPNEILRELELKCQERNLSGMSFELLTFLRIPRSHVYSQYLEMKYDWLWNWNGKWKFIRDFPTITQFLDLFTHGNGTNHTDYHIPYHPQDMQTRALICEKDIKGYHKLSAGDLGKALENVNSYKFIGIAEFFQASTCIFHDKVQPGSPLPDFCDCRNETKWSSFDFPHIRHYVPKHSLEDLSNADLLKADRLTQMDLTVYRAGIKRFYSEVRELEERRGLRIHCK